MSAVILDESGIALIVTVAFTIVGVVVVLAVKFARIEERVRALERERDRRR